MHIEKLGFRNDYLFWVSLTPHSTLPEHAHFLCQDFDSMISLALLQPLCDLVETIWVVGGPRVYQVTFVSLWVVGSLWCSLTWARIYKTSQSRSPDLGSVLTFRS